MKKQRQGMALMIVVAVVALLTPLAIHYHGRASSHLRLAARTARHDRALSLARCGIYLTMEVLQQDRRPYFFLPHCNPEHETVTEGRPSDLERAYLWLHESRERGLPFEGGLLQVRLEDDMGRISLNRSQTVLLAALLQSVGVMQVETSDILAEEREVDRSREMAAAIVDWRDPDTVVTLGIGAEDREYLSKAPPYRCRNGSLHSLGELSLVRDFDAKVLANYDLADLVTLFGPGHHVNVNTAPDLALAALPGIYGSGQTAAMITEIKRNRPFRSMAALRTTIAGVEQAAWNKLFRSITLNSNRYVVKAIGTYVGTRATVEAIVQRQGKKFLVLSWRER